MNNVRSSVLRAAPAFRDLGGLPAGGGKAMRRGLVFRSSALTELPLEDQAALEELGLSLVCDLRSVAERAADPCVTSLDRASRLNIDLAESLRTHIDPIFQRLRADPSAEASLEMMLCMYTHLPVTAASHLRMILLAIADGKLPVLIHCSAGKDRTGFVVAMLLGILGVSRSHIYSDYLHSVDGCTDVHRERTARLMLQLTGRPLDGDALHVMSAVRPEYLDAMFNTIETKWGGLQPYFKAIGVEDKARSSLRTLLLE